MSLERRTLLAMLGAKLVLTPGAEGMKGAIARAEQLAKERRTPGYRSSLKIRPTWKFIARHGGGNLGRHGRQGGHFGRGCGNGGTITGCVEVIKARKPSFEAIAVDPKDSPVIAQTLAGQPLKPALIKSRDWAPGLFPGTCI